eukprot:m.231440 g.231440  ORF g.231440 m.231440 type:complete len:260 (+) comp12217_c0_seq1:38-817(+)
MTEQVSDAVCAAAPLDGDAAWRAERRATRKQARQRRHDAGEPPKDRAHVNWPALEALSLQPSDPGALRVVIDLAYTDVQNEWELMSLSHQIRECYGFIKRMRDPLALHVVGITPPFQELLSKLCCDTWRVGLHSTTLQAVFPDPATLIYLSPDASEPLGQLDRGGVYVIGGLIDRTRIRGASLGRASHLAIRSRRLPLHECGFHGVPRDLNVTTVLSALARVDAGASWATALQEFIPLRTARIGAARVARKEAAVEERP